MIKVLLADDHSIVRAGLRRIIEESEDIEVIAEADEGRTAIHLAREKKPAHPRKVLPQQHLQSTFFSISGQLTPLMTRPRLHRPIAKA